MRAHDTDAWWLRDDLVIIGFEEDDENEDEEENNDDDEESEDEESEGNEDDDEGSEDEDEDDDESPKITKKDVEGLKSALRKERMARKKADRELRKLKAGKKPVDDESDEDDKDDDEKTKDSPKLAKEQEKNQKLATKLLDQAVDTAIIKHAGDFKNTDEVLLLINRKEIEVDQDEDDPTEIEIDEESIIEAVKKLRKKSPHLLKSKEERVQSGSKFGGRKKTSKEPSDDALRKKYAALRR